MAGLNRVAPTDIHAVVVGLERYPRAPRDWSLRGAGKDAVRFARWLTRGGVPPQNITLLLSPMRESGPLLEAAAANEGLTCRQVASAHDVRRVFIDEFRQAAGGLLYVYWGGHGVLGEDGRLLFHPDASAEDKLCLSVEELRVFLTQMASHGFRQQVLFFDACATFVEEHGSESAPVVVPLPQARRETAQQFLLHASRDGQAAEQDDVAESGAFSTVLLQWLEEHAADLHPDLTALHHAVRQHFEKQRAANGPTQTPVTCRYLTLDGTEDDTETYTAPVDPTARLEVMGVLETMFPNAGELKVHAARVARACGAARLADACSTRTFAEVLLSTPRAMATLIDLLSHDAVSATAEPFRTLALAHVPPGLLSVGDYADLRELLMKAPEMSPATVAAITQHILPGASGVQMETGSTVSGAQLLAHVENLEQHPGGRSHTNPRRRTAPAVIRFTEHLAAVFDQYPGWCRKLNKWGERVADRLGVDATTLEDLRTAAQAWARLLTQSSATPRVVVQVYPDPAAQTFTCVVWSDPGTGELARYAHDDNGIPLAPARAVRLIERAIRSLSVSDNQAPVVEIVLEAADMLSVPVHTWNGADPGHVVPLLLAVRRRLALRCAPLASTEAEEGRRAMLARRWHGRADGKAVYLDQIHAQGYSAYGRLEADQDVARVVVRTGGDDAARMIQLALYLGYPVILWDHEAAQALSDTYFVPLDPEGTIPELPERVRRYWAKVCEDPVGHPVRPALVLEDPERQMPPAPAMPRPSARDEASMR
ncbi:caspase family protein [Streptomyces sp. NPDC005727]|uniref:VMAP-C domain-containing protein n=1 Tax=Streptomyces sp. NPDC005727 TaxID=3157053 RepID=UPI0033C1F10E